MGELVDMNIHEYQAKELLRKYNVAVLNGKVAQTVDDAVNVAKKIGGKLWAVKAQIHAGGRGKAGGIKLAKSLNEVRDHSKRLLGRNLVTHQTGGDGEVVKSVLIEEGREIAQEFYVALLIDRVTCKVTYIASSEGGVEIETTAANSPDRIVKVAVDPAFGLSPFVSRKLAFCLGLKGELLEKASSFFEGLYNLFISKDCSLVEINPMVVTKDGELFALDAKISFDDSALQKHKDILQLKESTSEQETEISAHDFSYIPMDGNIGCMVNGAGLAMATMDIIKLEGGSPANFLDVGGNTTAEAVEQAFSIILNDNKVEGILVNIFGGIVKCDLIALGIVAATKKLDVKVPLVVRLEGTNVALGRKILKESELPLIAAENLGDAAKKIIEAISKQKEGA